ncbi:MAG: phosphatidylserine decarboxylase family protein [Candidatus Marinimicrobia bacterium]|nr:phosphatidylserine decarboxylase family protein [Candidatus Neomarinimicrobiota bacterium]MBT3496216.1 phosphatidylserine decarboxylase family protein [Candidatus Neomarinimicrobiota bacterium]MBT3693064.1 phosphatidylserine decarboxylase family protein [Candidatus Neomarinimicrobiota bacterium]MBT3732778.1 phosphatidylserine decarboxylase family protein [Candidatus Neomarinimicrobiota bacterium]MBT4143928.1 phosphatidylserine decarboxylase family protein [Candidatus Neomarinimicrobiota bact
MKIAPEGRNLLFISFLLSVFFLGVNYSLNNTYFFYLGLATGLFFLFSLNFFRDPIRELDAEDLEIVSPADGKIVALKSVIDNSGEERQLISIFLNVFNVHTNRMPVDGTFTSVQYKKGKFLAAFDHKASDENEQTIIEISTPKGKVGLKQIAGLVARRIHCYAYEGKKMSKGDRLGFIMFGSRTDIILPETVKIQVKMGQKVTGNKTIIGKWNG